MTCLRCRPRSGRRQAPRRLAPQFRRSLVDYHTSEPVGTIIVDTPNTYLYLVLGNGKALRYGIGVGREGFTWTGAERVSRMAEWPDSNPPEQMIERQPYLPRFDGRRRWQSAWRARPVPRSDSLPHSRHQSALHYWNLRILRMYSSNQRGHHGSLHTSEGRHSGSRAAEQAGRFAHRSHGGYPVWGDRHAEEEIQT